MQSLSEHKLFADLDPIKVLVKREYLQNFEGGQGQYVTGTLQSIWAYASHQPTFTVLLEDGTIYSYLPAAAFTASPLPCSENLGSKAACGVYSPSDSFVLYRTKMFDARIAICFSPSKEYLGIGEYIFSIEWPNDNEVAHFMCVDKASYCFVANHKMLLLPEVPTIVPSLPLWKKLRDEWTRK
jgi:hypothetical protein